MVSIDGYLTMKGVTSQKGWQLQEALYCSPDGKRIAGGDGFQVKVWDAASGYELLTLTGHGPAHPVIARNGLSGSVVLAWAAVGLPIAWGVYQTLIKASVLLK